MGSIWYVAAVFVTVPLGVVVVWWRRKLTWKTVLARKKGETKWFGSITWIISNWRQFSGLLWAERVALEKRVIQVNNKEYVPNHQCARDTMNDTSWLVRWIEGVCYCFILLFGGFALIEYEVYGIGDMTVGTYYACLRICLSVGKSLRKLAGSFVDTASDRVAAGDCGTSEPEGSTTAASRSAGLGRKFEGRE